MISLQRTLLMALTALLSLAGHVTIGLAGADTVTTRSTIPISIVENNPCTDEPVRIEGTVHFHSHATRTPSGNVHFNVEWNFREVSATGLDTGARYEATSQPVTFTSNDRAGDGAEFTSTNRVLLISPGADDNLQVRFHQKGTINARGEVKVDTFEVTSRCVG